MNMGEFIKYVEDALRIALGEKYKVMASKAREGFKYDHLLFIYNMNAELACIELGKLYYRYIMENLTFEELIRHILEECEMQINNSKGILELLNDYSYAKDNIRGCFINTRRNLKRLSGLMHREYMDLSLIYLVELQNGNLNYTVKVSKELADIWDVTEEELYSHVMKKVVDAEEDVSIRELSEYVGAESTDMTCYVVASKDFRYGSVQLLNKVILEKGAGLLGNDFYILPSSVHDLIFVRNDHEDISKAEELAEIVKSVNRSEVSERDFLSDHVYYYDAERGKVAIAA